MQVVLSSEDIVRAALIAGIINGVKMAQLAAGLVRNRRVSNIDDFGMHYVGMMGEIAIGKTFGIPIRQAITAGGDGGVDITIFGETVQVKTSTHSRKGAQRLHLIVDDLSEISADWLMACSVLWPVTIEIEGFISARRFRSRATKQDFGYGMKFAVPYDDLAPIDRFQHAVEEMRHLHSTDRSSSATLAAIPSGPHQETNTA